MKGCIPKYIILLVKWKLAWRKLNFCRFATLSLGQQSEEFIAANGKLVLQIHTTYVIYNLKLIIPACSNIAPKLMYTH
jgi:hypothetical protein